MTNYYSRNERLEIVLNIVKKLKNYELKNGSTINLYNENLCEFIKEFKEITNNYIKQDDNNVKEFKGKLKFTEINKTIEYRLPSNKNKEPLFVIRMN
jgi:single-stranded DNA-specific DHH superfamily exonuclease